MICWDEAYFTGAVTAKADRRLRPKAYAATLKSMGQGERTAWHWMWGIE